MLVALQKYRKQLYARVLAKHCSIQLALALLTLFASSHNSGLLEETLFSVSYLYYGSIALVMVVVIGNLASFITGSCGAFTRSYFSVAF